MWKINKERGPWQTESETRWGSKVVPIIVVIEPMGVRIRAKGTRTAYRLPWAFIHQKACEAAALAAAANKPKRRRRITRGAI